MLNCPQCGHDNDIGRIFCAKCGQKLEISRVGVPSRIRRSARKGKASVPFAHVAMFLFKKFVQITLLAAATAFFVSVWLLPRDASRLPDAKDLEAFQKRRADLDEAYRNQTGERFVFREEELNAKLAEAVRNTRKAAGENAGGIQIEKLTVALGEGQATLTIVQKWKWFRLAVQVVARLKNDGVRWAFVPEEFRVGRWLAPSALSPHLTGVLERFLADLSPEKEKLEQTATAEITPGEMALTAPKPAAAAP